MNKMIQNEQDEQNLNPHNFGRFAIGDEIYVKYLGGNPHMQRRRSSALWEITFTI